LSVGKKNPGQFPEFMPGGSSSVLVRLGFEGVQHRVSVSILCPSHDPKKLQARIMVGTLANALLA